MTIGTLALANEIVEGLTQRLSPLSEKDLGGIFSVYISGSYARGDFLESNSDLDICVVFRSGFGSDLDRNTSYHLMVSEVQSIIGSRQFYSHTPGGVDWEPIRWDWLPTPQSGPSLPGTGHYYTPFGIFLFDLHRNLKVCWGRDPRPLLAAPPNPVSMTSAWYRTCLYKLTRIEKTDTHDNAMSQHFDRAGSMTFKSLQLAQIIFGEETLNKKHLPKLYRNHVPEFPMKEDGTRLIQEIVNARYPHKPPHFEAPNHYRKLVKQLWDLTRR